MAFSNRLRQLRKERGLTLQEVAEQLGMSKSNLSELETGEHGCTNATLQILARFYNVSTDYLNGTTDNPNAQIVTVADADGTLTKIEYELLDKVKGLTIEDFIEINRYIDFIKSKKGNESKWEIDF